MRVVQPFRIKDCNLSLMATGEIAESLSELRDVLQRIPSSSLYYHFWGSQLRVSFAHPEYHNDFARWAHTTLHDDILAEQLAIIDPTEFPEMEDLRRKLLDVIEDRIEQIDYPSWSGKEMKFHFLRSIIIVFNTNIEVAIPPDLKKVVPVLSSGSIFYHFIDARRRTSDRSDDFSLWLAGYDDQYKQLIKDIQGIDTYFLSLPEIRKAISERLNQYL